MAAEVKVEEGTVFLNKGKRHFDLAPGKDGKARRHAPGTTMAYSAEEAKIHEGYSDLIDVTKVPGQVNVRQVKADNAKLLDENAQLRAQLAALTAAPAPVAEPKWRKKTEAVEA